VQRSLDVGEAVGKLDVDDDLVNFDIGHEQLALITFQPLDLKAEVVGHRFNLSPLRQMQLLPKSWLGHGVSSDGTSAKTLHGQALSRTLPDYSKRAVAPRSNEVVIAAAEPLTVVGCSCSQCCQMPLALALVHPAALPLPLIRLRLIVPLSLSALLASS